MIDVSPQIGRAIKTVCDNVNSNYPKDFTKLPVIMYVEEDNHTVEKSFGKESKAYIRFKVDIWTNSMRELSDYTDKINEAITNLGMKRTQCLTVPDPSGLSHKVIRYEGIVDLETERVYQ